MARSATDGSSSDRSEARSGCRSRTRRRVRTAGGGATSALGWPVSDEHAASRGGRVSDFQFGSLYFTPSGAAYAVLGRIGEKYDAIGRDAAFGYPIGDEVRNANGGFEQPFENG